MILFLSPYQNAPECAALIENATKDQVKIVDSMKLALAALRTNEFNAVVADENLLECSPGSAESLVQRMGGAMPVIVDMACLRAERVCKFVTAAFQRRQLEWELARKQALAEVRSEMKSELTGLLLSSQMALNSEQLSASVSERLEAVLEIAQRMKSRLEGELEIAQTRNFHLPQNTRTTHTA